MITVPSQEIATFLGSHLDHVLQRTGNSFLSSVAADREFRAGCAIMDVLNAVESVQSSLRVLLEKKVGSKAQQSEYQAMEVRVISLYLLHCLYSYLPIQQNPFLCLFVDIYNCASQDENLKSERFVTSVILNGKGEELAQKTPSELIALAQKVESRPVNLGMLEEYLPEVPIEDQVKIGLGWDSQHTHGDKKRVWETFMIGSRHGRSALASALATGSETAAAQEDNEDELEEWEIEAERRFQDSDIDDAPSLPLPASKKYPVKPKVTPVPIAVAGAATTDAMTQPSDQDQVKRRRKIWPRK